MKQDMSVQVIDKKTLNRKVPFHKPYITGDEVTEVLDCIQSGWLTDGAADIQIRGSVQGIYRLTPRRINEFLHRVPSPRTESNGLEGGGRGYCPCNDFYCHG